MLENSTLDLIVKLIYNECLPEEKVFVQRELAHNYLLREQYEEMLDAYKLLPKVKFSPKKSTLKKIMEYC